MDKNSHTKGFPIFAKTTSKTVQQNKKVREPMAPRTVLPKQTLPPNHRFINIYHGQELTFCVFPPLCENNVHNSAAEHESQRAHGTNDRPPKTNPSPNHRSIKIYHGQELTYCVFPPILQKQRPKQCNRT